MSSNISYHRLGKSTLYASNLGVGTAGLAGLHQGEVDSSEAAEAIKSALRRGINFLDTSPFYNERRAEQRLGELLTSVEREKVIVATKFGRYVDLHNQTERFDYSAANVRESVVQSLRTMNLSYIDVLQVHDVEFAKSLEELRYETIPAMVELRRERVIKAIGITGYSTRHLRALAEVCSDSLDIVMSYLRYSLFQTRLADDLQFYKEKDISIINASPLGIGLLTNEVKIPEWHPAPLKVKTACQRAAKYCKDNNIDLARIALRHSVENSDITMTLWSTRSAETMQRNITQSLLPLTPAESQHRQQIVSGIINDVINVGWDSVSQARSHPYWILEERKPR